MKNSYASLGREYHFKQFVSKIGWANIYATYDDHDYGINDGDKTYSLRNLSQQLFLDFFKVPKDSERRSRSGVYSSHSYEIKSRAKLIVKVILLDTRYNKDPYNFFKGEGDFLGMEQWAWLENELGDPIADIILLGSSIQVLADDKFLEETWSRFPAARKRLLSLVINKSRYELISHSSRRTSNIN